jgi:hypothetical protein
MKMILAGVFVMVVAIGTASAQGMPSRQRVLDARLALCAAVSNAIDEARRGDRPADPILAASGTFRRPKGGRHDDWA